ncbi:MAG TPA: LysR substrate-binding domain-containing protein [Candidatus Acidoferrales bacterium]|nr:LysR substrate-binding domain-containing protein [Candidatus Acidoferrales bacterium]
MELHQLRYFCAVARAGNFTRAAENQHVAQPSLSQQIHKLEDELGAKLFDRFPRFARLTESGKAFLPKAEAILRQVGEARAEIQEKSRAEVGTVYVGSIPTIAPYFLPPVLARFAGRYPGVSVRVIEDITSGLLDHLHHGRVDLVLLALPVRGEELQFEELFREPLFASLPETHRLASRKTIGLAEIRNEPFLLLKEGHCFRENALAACRRSRIHPNVIFESGHFSTILSMVATGMGVSVVPAMVVCKHPGCRFVRLSDDRMARSVGLMQLKHRFPTRAQRALMEELRHHARAIRANLPR